MRWKEVVAAGSGLILLGVMTSGSWYQVRGLPGFNAWASFAVVDVLLLAAATAGIIQALLTLAIGVDRRPPAVGVVGVELGVLAVIAVVYRSIEPPELSGGSFYIDPTTVHRSGGLWLGLIATLALAAGIVLSADRRPAALRKRPAATAAPAGAVSLNSATETELLALGLSITQARRVLRYRDEFGGFSSFEQFDQVPGFPKALRAELRGKLTV